ncbi:MAG: hypothetical protein ACJAUG_002387 [Halioglobus sp.]|jgi:hypothetical protein
MGNSDASVTMPNPESELFELTTPHTPIPSASKSGTVTGSGYCTVIPGKTKNIIEYRYSAEKEGQCQRYARNDGETNADSDTGNQLTRKVI